MTPLRSTTTAALLSVAFLLTACGSGGGGVGSGGPTKTGPQSQAADPAPTATTGPSPNAAQTATLVAALKDIDLALGANSVQAVDNAVSACTLLQGGSDPDTVVADTFPSPELTLDQQRAVVAVIESSFCSVG